MTTLESTAINYLRRHIDAGQSLDAFLAKRPCELIPGVHPNYLTTWIYVGGHMFADNVGDIRIRLKAHQIGITFCWRDGRNQHAIFDASKLWDDIVNPKPVQLSFWELIGEAA